MTKNIARALAQKVWNPKIRRTTFQTLRHWFGNMEYQKTTNIPHIRERLGHRA